MVLPASFNRVSIERKVLQDNYRLLRKRAAGSAFLAMIKADGYGHGMIECARALGESGCSIFGVAELREAILLRQAGIGGTIYAMIGFDTADADLICIYDITPVVYDTQSLRALSRAAMARKKDIAVHVKVDCGMSRLGIFPDDVKAFVAAIVASPGLVFAGIAGHFPCSDNLASSNTVECFRVFDAIRKDVKVLPPPIAHIANSGATLLYPEIHCDMVRCGITLYGYYPDGKKERGPLDLQPVMSFTTRILQIKDVPSGTGVSYGHTYVTERQTRLAVLPVGYEDGFSRDLSNCGEVLIRGRRAPVRGRVCMNLCMVDVTEIEGAVVGDEVVLLGRQGDESIDADEIAEKIGTISYEVLCMIGNNNEREFI